MRVWWTLMLVGLPCGAAAAQDSTVSRIDNVLVHPGGAIVERLTVVSAGQRLLRFACLPARIDADSLRVQAGAGVRVGEVVLHAMPRSHVPECAAAPLDARIRELEDRKAAVDAEFSAHDIALGYLKTFAAKDERTSGVAAPAATADALRRSALAALQQQQDLQRRKDEIDKQLAPLVAERERRGAADAQVQVASIRVAAERDAELRLAYRIPNAGWEPGYRAFLDTATAQVRLERRAQVAQSSGVDWSGVKLRLSTVQARAAAEGAAPVSWRLALAEQRQRVDKASFAVPAAAAVLAQGAPMREEASFDISVFQGEFATEFEVPGRVDLRSDGEHIAFALDQQRADARAFARLQPQADPNAYLMASVARPAGVWPAGVMELYRDGTRVGQARWRVAAQERIDLPFGRDDLMRVRIEPEKRNTANSGLIGPRVERNLARSFVVENGHRVAMAVQLLEAAPVAEHNDVRVQSRFEPAPSEENWRGQPGVMAWTATLEPGKSLRVAVAYHISYPKKIPISGL